LPVLLNFRVQFSKARAGSKSTLTDASFIINIKRRRYSARFTGNLFKHLRAIFCNGISAKADFTVRAQIVAGVNGGLCWAIAQRTEYVALIADGKNLWTESVAASWKHLHQHARGIVTSWLCLSRHALRCGGP
jgi:hypothetical protein